MHKARHAGLILSPIICQLADIPYRELVLDIRLLTVGHHQHVTVIL